MRRLLACAAVAAALGSTSGVLAKEIGFHSPQRRNIYAEGDSFGTALDQTRRNFVIEVATGLAAEGNLGLLLGVLNLPVRHVDLYVGFGIEANPAAHYTLSARYTLPLGTFKPYLGLGYLFVDTYEIGVASHNVFAELGHRWSIHRTYRLLVGVGLRYLAVLDVQDDSLLNDPDVDQVLLEEQLDDTQRFVPLLALRFSRAF